MRRCSVVSPEGFSVGQIAAAGFFSAIPMTAVTAPMERVKVLSQVQNQRTGAGEKPKYAGSLDCARQLLREGGVRSLYRGTVMTLARDGPGSAAYFAAYEVVKKRLSDPPGADGKPRLSLLAVMAAGATAGVAMWIPVFPVDTVKSRLQSAPGNPTIGGVVRDLYVRGGGVRAFFPGLAPALGEGRAGERGDLLGRRAGADGHGEDVGLDVRCLFLLICMYKR